MPRILIVDDLDIVRDTLEAMLSFLGCETVSVSNGKKAIEEFSKALQNNNPFDLVILDLVLPEISGTEVFKELKKLDPAVKAVISSGYSDDAAVENYEQIGFSGVLVKPYTLEDIESLLKNIGVI